jgi:hypothetical protein
MLEKLKAAAAWLYNALGDKRTKNGLLVLLLIGLAFDLISPEKFHQLREAVLSLAV